MFPLLFKNLLHLFIRWRRMVHAMVCLWRVEGSWAEVRSLSTRGTFRDQAQVIRLDDKSLCFLNHLTILANFNWHPPTSILDFWNIIYLTSQYAPYLEKLPIIFVHFKPTEVPGILCLNLSNTGLTGVCPCTWLLCGYWRNLNSDPHTCLASTSPAGLAIQPTHLFLWMMVQFFTHADPIFL